MINRKFNELIKKARKESNKLSNEFRTEVFITIQVSFNHHNLFVGLNPFCINLKSYDYTGVARNLITGKFDKIPNLKKSDFYKNCLTRK